MQLQTLPPEILDYILTNLDFLSLYRLRHVNDELRQLVDATLDVAPVIHPARAKLLRLDTDLYRYSRFTASKKYYTPHLQEFSRQKYLDELQIEIDEGTLDDAPYILFQRNMRFGYKNGLKMPLLNGSGQVYHINIQITNPAL